MSKNRTDYVIVKVNSLHSCIINIDRSLCAPVWYFKELDRIYGSAILLPKICGNIMKLAKNLMHNVEIPQYLYLPTLPTDYLFIMIIAPPWAGLVYVWLYVSLSWLGKLLIYGVIIKGLKNNAGGGGRVCASEPDFNFCEDSPNRIIIPRGCTHVGRGGGCFPKRYALKIKWCFW